MTNESNPRAGLRPKCLSLEVSAWLDFAAWLDFSLSPASILGRGGQEMNGCTNFLNNSKTPEVCYCWLGQLHQDGTEADAATRQRSAWLESKFIHRSWDRVCNENLQQQLC
jgi:hypothetical protein